MKLRLYYSIVWQWKDRLYDPPVSRNHQADWTGDAHYGCVQGEHQWREGKVLWVWRMRMNQELIAPQSLV
jgi:hypothetical protein